ncbi:hypothetical protein EUZ93_00505 [Wolbachia pipientis]|nr:hypothetical protein [Wolbachia pipientis]
MPGTQDQDTVEPLSYTPIGEDGKTSPGTSPIPALGNTGQRTDETPPPVPPKSQALQLDETPSPLPPKNSALQRRDSLNLDTIVPPPSPSQIRDEPTHAFLSEVQGSLNGRLKESIHATINPDTKSSEKSLDSRIDNQSSGVRRSASQETVFDNPWDRNESEKNLFEKFSQDSDTPSTLPPSYKTDGSETTDSKFKLQKNRFLPRAKYAIQQKGFIIFSAAAIMFSASAALVYLQDKAKFAALFANGSLYVTIPVIALASLLVILPIYLAVKQFRNTREYQTQGKNADKILDKVLEHQPKDKIIKSVRLEYSNGTHSNFVFNAWESKNDLINIDEKVVSRTNKIESVINDRPLFTALLTSVVAANVALPLGLLTTGSVQTFYQNPLTNNIGLSLLVCSGALALLILCLGVHYYRKTNCTSLIYSQEKIDTENVNKKFVEEIERERTNVLKENHGKDAKCCSLTLEQVVVQSHNCKDAVYSVG